MLYPSQYLSSRPLRPRGSAGRGDFWGKVPGLHAAGLREEPPHQRPHGAGAGGCGQDQGVWGHSLASRGCGAMLRPGLSTGGTPAVGQGPHWGTLQAPEGESQPMTEVDLFVSTQRIKVLTADTQVRRNGSAHVAPGLLRPSRLPWDLLCLPTAVGSRTGMAHGRCRAAGRRRVTPQPSHTRVPCIPQLAARGFSCKLRLAGAN